ncbi:MAG: lysophospholipase [Bdellovibrio sp.]
MYSRSEGFFKGYHETNLFFQVWDQPFAQGTIVITHGHGEHSESYHRFVNAFAGDKWRFYAWDLRGHGRSDGRRGYVAEFDDYCQDYKIFLEMVLKEPSVQQGPVILFCHSLGALIQIKTLLRNPDISYQGLIVSGPLFGLSLPVPAYKAKGAAVLNMLLPQITMGNELSNDMLTRDPEVIREFEQDALRHHRMSPGAFIGLMDACEYVHHRANEVKKPALFLLAEADPVISTPEARRFYGNIGSTRKELYIYPGAKHEVINDIIRNTVFADIKKYLDSFMESLS